MKLRETIEENNKLIRMMLEELDTNNHDTSDIKKVIVAGSTPKALMKQAGVNILSDIVSEIVLGK